MYQRAQLVSLLSTLSRPFVTIGRVLIHPWTRRAGIGLVIRSISPPSLQRAKGIFVGPDSIPIVVGGKTGSGDNELITVSRNRHKRTVQTTNRTATFVFYIGERHYGVVLAYVPGPEASAYRFTSALPVSVLKLIAPTVNARLHSLKKG